MLTYPELSSVGLGFKGGTSPGSASGSIHVKVEVVAHIHTESSLVVLSRSMRFTLVTNHHCVTGLLQHNSTPEKNLMKDGYLAPRNQSQALLTQSRLDTYIR